MTAGRLVPIAAGVALVVLGVTFAVGNAGAWPFALGALVIGIGIAYAGWSGQRIQKLGPAGVELAEYNAAVVQETQREYAARHITAEASFTQEPASWQAHAEAVGGTGTAHNASVSDSVVTRDEVSATIVRAPSEYEQLAMFAETPQALAKVIVDAIDAVQLRQTGRQTDSPVPDGTDGDD